MRLNDSFSSAHGDTSHENSLERGCVRVQFHIDGVDRKVTYECFQSEQGAAVNGRTCAGMQARNK
jgi:hypothetical protein